MVYAQSARCRHWGAHQSARRISGLTADEQRAIKSGVEVRLSDCPPVKGVTDRRIVFVRGRFYARMPKD